MEGRSQRAIDCDNRGVKNQRLETCGARENRMQAVIAIGFMLLVWVIVLWGSSHFNNNIH
jgi:hypothetical protein